MNNILIVTPDSKQVRCLVEELGFTDLDIVSCDLAEEAEKLIEGCNIVLGSPALIAPILPYAKRLEWVQSSFAGVDILCSGDLRTDYLLTGVKGVFGALISEYVFAWVLAIERGLFETREYQKLATWKKFPYRSLQGVTMGICGMGSIGNNIAQTARHFGMHVLGFKRTQADNPHIDQMYTHNSFGNFLKQLNYLVNTLPGTRETKHL
ncbi:MAG: D-2-hydroxyacid dehydrogenase, partial [Proteobacteria bacterium]|nr:D-2-hydroxyacid dehydrogenase [Pseudomonadota bacterium]